MSRRDCATARSRSRGDIEDSGRYRGAHAYWDRHGSLEGEGIYAAADAVQAIDAGRALWQEEECTRLVTELFDATFA